MLRRDWLASGVLHFHREELLFKEATQGIMLFISQSQTKIYSCSSIRTAFYRELAKLKTGQVLAILGRVSCAPSPKGVLFPAWQIKPHHGLVGKRLTPNYLNRFSPR